MSLRNLLSCKLFYPRFQFSDTFTILIFCFLQQPPVIHYFFLPSSRQFQNLRKRHWYCPLFFNLSIKIFFFIFLLGIQPTPLVEWSCTFIASNNNRNYCSNLLIHCLLFQQNIRKCYKRMQQRWPMGGHWSIRLCKNWNYRCESWCMY